MSGGIVGLRFRKSVKLLPGLRLNLSLGGASVSLGRPGATLNISSRGVRATTGIPGTGLSYSTQIAGARRRSTRQLAAEYRRVATAQQHAAALADIEAMERELEELLDSWRDAPPPAEEDDFRRALEPQPFGEDAAAVAPPDFETERRALEQAVFGAAAAAHPPPRHARSMATAAGIVVGVLTVIALGSVTGPSLRVFASFSAGLLTGLTLHARLVGQWSRTLHRTVVDAFATWPARREALQREYDRRRDAQSHAHATAARDWSVRERERVALVRRALERDLSAIQTLATRALESADFPFETECEVAIEDAATSYVRLDLPEIEDVIPEMRLKALKSGALKEVRRKKSERCDAYAHLAMGLGFHVAGSVFSAAPAMEVVHVVAYTQRKQRRSDRIGDDYVYELAITRWFYTAMDRRSADPLKAAADLRARFERRKDGEFKSIDPPTWLMEVFGDAAAASAV